MTLLMLLAVRCWRDITEVWSAPLSAAPEGVGRRESTSKPCYGDFILAQRALELHRQGIEGNFWDPKQRTMGSESQLEAGIQTLSWVQPGFPVAPLPVPKDTMLPRMRGCLVFLWVKGVIPVSTWQPVEWRLWDFYQCRKPGAQGKKSHFISMEAFVPLGAWTQMFYFVVKTMP